MDRARARFATGDSDLLTDIHAYDEYARLHSEGKSQSAIKAFCEEVIFSILLQNPCVTINLLQNFMSLNTLREITTLRHDFLSSLLEIGLVPLSSTSSSAALNANKTNANVLKAVILGGLWPQVVHVHLPKAAIKFDKVQSGTVQRENAARDFKMYDLKTNTRVFLHPGSVLFGAGVWKSPFLAYFHKYMTSKIFLRDATEVCIPNVCILCNDPALRFHFTPCFCLVVPLQLTKSLEGWMLGLVVKPLS